MSLSVSPSTARDGLPAHGAAAKLPVGYGLIIGAAISVALWIGVVRLVWSLLA